MTNNSNKISTPTHLYIAGPEPGSPGFTQQLVQLLGKRAMT